MITHYIDSHDYQPPLEFQEAVMFSVGIRRMDYEKKLEAFFPDCIPREGQSLTETEVRTQGAASAPSGRYKRFIGFPEPSGRGPRSFLKIWRCLARPGDEAIGTHEHSAQA